MRIPGLPQFSLRDLSGHEELAYFEPNAEGASRLVLRLVEGQELEDEARLREQMTSSARDRLVAGLYQRCFGDQVCSRVACPTCEREIEIEFSLTAYLESLGRGSVPKLDESFASETGLWSTASGARFRTPTVADEFSVRELSGVEARRQLVSACVLESGGESAESLEERISRLSQLVCGDIETLCAHCESPSQIGFDICEFFMKSLTSERPLLLREVHCLARSYGWALREILDLPRASRRQLVHLVLAELDPELREVA